MKGVEKQAVCRLIAYWTVIPVLSWQLMQLFHEAGHVLAAILTRGKILELNLHPLRFSHTLVSPNPQPIIVIWAGPLLGVCFPLLLWQLSKLICPSRSHLFRFLAGFCCVANGLYIGSVLITPVGDALELVLLNVSIALLSLYAMISTIVGFILWNGQGPHFGLGSIGRKISQQEVIELCIISVTLASLEFILFQR